MNHMIHDMKAKREADERDETEQCRAESDAELVANYQRSVTQLSEADQAKWDALTVRRMADETRALAESHLVTTNLFNDVWNALGIK